MYVDQDTRIQILDRMDQLPSAEKDQCGAFVVRRLFSPHSPFPPLTCHCFPLKKKIQREDRSLVLWSYNIENILPLYQDFDDKLIKHIWRNRHVGKKPAGGTESSAASSIGPQSTRPTTAGSQASSHAGFNLNPHPNLNEKAPLPVNGTSDGTSADSTAEDKEEEAPPEKEGPWYSWRLKPRKAPRARAEDEADPEKRKDGKRKLVLLGPIYAGCGAGLAACELRAEFFNVSFFFFCC